MLGLIWKDRRGQVLVEMALALPAFLLMTAGVIDMGLVFQQYVTMGHAAEMAAQTAADLLGTSGFPLQSSGIPAWISNSARDAAVRAAPTLRAAYLEVNVDWDGPATTVSRSSPPYRFQVTVPYAPNTGQTADLRNQHGFGYYQPRIYDYNVWDPYQPGVWYLDNTADVPWRWFNFPHNQGYRDLSGPYTWEAYPWGLWVGLIFGPAGTGWGGGVFLPFRTYTQSTWSPWWSWEGTSWAYPGAWGSAIGSIYDTWRRTWTDRFWNPDRTNSLWWQGLSGTFNSADSPQYVGNYALRQGDRTFTVTSQRGVVEEFTSRPVRAVVRYRVQAFTPLLAPILNGKVLSRLAVARAERQEVR